MEVAAYKVGTRLKGRCCVGHEKWRPDLYRYGYQYGSIGQGAGDEVLHRVRHIVGGAINTEITAATRCHKNLNVAKGPETGRLCGNEVRMWTK